MNSAFIYLAAILPTIILLTMFYFLMRNMLEGDRRERLAQSKFEAEQDVDSTADNPDPSP